MVQEQRRRNENAHARHEKLVEKRKRREEEWVEEKLRREHDTKRQDRIMEMTLLVLVKSTDRSLDIVRVLHGEYFRTSSYFIYLVGATIYIIFRTDSNYLSIARHE